MKFYNDQWTFRYTWRQVACGFWKRYPNPYSKHVVTEDVVAREVRGNKLFTKRLLTKTNTIQSRLPTALAYLAPREITVLEESVMDPVRKTITTYTRNISKHVLSVEEKCVYKADQSNSGWVLCERASCFKSSFYGLGSAIESGSLSRFRKSAVKASKGFEHILAFLYPSLTVQAPAPDLSPAPSPMAASKEKFKDKARKAKELAKARAPKPITVSCDGKANS